MAQIPLTKEQDDWRLPRLKANYQDRESMTIAQLCRHECNSMAPKFAERFRLITVAGWCNNWEHVWCKDAEGNIIDPTAEQFQEPRTYREVDPDVDVIKVGRCPNCGDDIMGTINDAKNGKISTSIHPECQDEYEAYVSREARNLFR